MKIKNISKKILGNGSFRLLPGESLNVSGNEIWVKNYLARKALQEVTETATAAADSTGQAPAASTAATGTSAKTTKSSARKTADK